MNAYLVTLKLDSTKIIIFANSTSEIDRALRFDWDPAAVDLGYTVEKVAHVVGRNETREIGTY
jgi:hypothetical protein